MNSDNLEPIRDGLAKGVVEDFLRALGPSSVPEPKPQWTTEERARLEFLKWRAERGLVPA